jgi:hypothetical protein
MAELSPRRRQWAFYGSVIACLLGVVFVAMMAAAPSMFSDAHWDLWRGIAVGAGSLAVVFSGWDAWKYWPDRKQYPENTDG